MTNSVAKHYENFPVATWLCPAHLRAPVSAIYDFARTADDIADEGNATAAQRLENLGAMRQDLLLTAGSLEHSGRWPRVFGALGVVLPRFQLPVPLLCDLLDAFEQDVRMSASQASYATDTELFDYCRRSANPVGRLMLHLYGISEPHLLAQSDNICTALQLINFWQDLGTDVQRGRHYVTDQACKRFKLQRADLAAPLQSTPVTALVADLVLQARQWMVAGAPLAKNIPGRAGWELRLVVQGGLRIAEKIKQDNYQVLSKRPKIGPVDIAVMAWRTLWM